MQIWNVLSTRRTGRCHSFGYALFAFQHCYLFCFIFPTQGLHNASNSWAKTVWNDRQLGVLKYLQTHFDLSRVHFRGASAGGLIATLACCGVDLDLAVEEAYNLSLQNCLFERPLGLIGIWGDLIRYWLHILLPSDAHKMCRSVPFQKWAHVEYSWQCISLCCEDALDTPALSFLAQCELTVLHDIQLFLMLLFE